MQAQLGVLLWCHLIGRARVLPRLPNRLSLLLNSHEHHATARPPRHSLFSRDGYTAHLPSGELDQLSHPNPLPSVPPGLCSVPPEILVPAANETLELVLGSRVELNCTVRWAGTEGCQPIPAWSKDGQWLGSGSSQDTAW